MDRSTAKARTLRLAVIGAGASGIVTAIKLRELGISDIAIFEKATDLGGTWRDNTYPGSHATCRRICTGIPLRPIPNGTSDTLPGRKFTLT